MRLNTARISQLIFLIVFLVLFIFTDYRGKDEIPVAVNSFFRADPLVGISYALATKTFTYLLLPAVLLFVFSIVLGRFFCGWICPLGTLIDLTTNRIRKTAPIRLLKTPLKYYLLLALLFAALFGTNLSGILDPLGILIRGMTFFIYPVIGFVTRSGWVGLYKIMGNSRDVLEPFYGFLRDYVLPFRETFYPLAFISLALLLGIFLLERFEKRNWCRNLCPLGTLLGILGHFSIFKRLPGRLCADCSSCRDICPTGFDTEVLQNRDCIRCMDCTIKCKFQRSRFHPKLAKKSNNAGTRLPVLERRVFIGGLLSGFLLSRSFVFTFPSRQEKLLRPPGVVDEDEFQKKCVRCGECMKVCPRNALYPDYSRSGIYGLFTPVIIPRMGYCEYNCNLCGQVCPTGAIPRLPLETKKKSLIGIAVIDKNICLPYAKRTNCIVCEEHCPISEKAIKFESVRE
ncbi:MAG TPA: 4Fe-4S binding protein, partial [Syntrophorhabdaceae bacterium]|nr:4Fe-4S binding protein [Syntrophorhabdaceae bacterium]